MKLVSIIIPTYNSFDKLVQCIDCIRQQTYSNLEIICVDDGSTLKATAVQERYITGDSRMRLVHNSQNRGPGAARNIGIKMATGDYIMFIDSDDTISPQMVEIMINAFENNRDIDLVMCGFSLYQDGKTPQIRKLASYCGTGEEFIRKHFKEAYKNLIINPPWNKLIRRQLLIDNELLFCEKINTLEDLIFSLELLGHVKHLAVVNQALYNYNYFTPGSLTTKYNDNLDEIILRIGDILSRNLNVLPNDYIFFCNDIVLKMISFLSQIRNNREFTFRESLQRYKRIISNKNFYRYVRSAKGETIKNKFIFFGLKCVMRINGV